MVITANRFVGGAERTAGYKAESDDPTGDGTVTGLGVGVLAASPSALRPSRRRGEGPRIVRLPDAGSAIVVETYALAVSLLP